MKALIGVIFVGLGALVASCVSPPRALVLDAVGPANPQLAVGSSNGTLVVFSACDPHADFNDLPYQRHYTDYRIMSRNGKLLQIVQNRSGGVAEGPKQLRLPVGKYCIVARANGYGRVTVPVVIRANRVTTVHLEGDSYWGKRSQLDRSNLVRLPDGEIAGWRAGTNSSSTP
jgi:hypothetical protein